VIGGEAMAIGLAKAERTGVAVVALRHSSHLGRIGDWAELCAEAGYASVHFVNVVGAGAIVAPFGGGDRRLSTNPFAAGMPILAGVVSGGQTNHPGVPIKGRVLNNMLSIILDPAPTGDRAGAASETETFIAWLKSSPPLEKGGEVMVPGDPERRARQTRAHGI